MSKPLKTVELFAGAGGLAIGMSKAGFDHHTVIERDHNAVATLHRNKADGVDVVRDARIYGGDVREFNFRDLRGAVQIVAGGPPCQPFSLGGRARGHADDRNLWPEATRAVREIQPHAFVFENVKGLLRQRWSNWYHYILRCLSYPNVLPKGDEDWQDHDNRLQDIESGGKFRGLKYNVIPKLLNAADFGVPQRRERVLLVGIRSDLGCEFHFPHATHSEDALLYDQWVSGEYWDRHKVPKSKRPEMSPRLKNRVKRLTPMFRDIEGQPWQTVRDVISDLPRISMGQTSRKITNHYYNPGAKSYKGHTGSPWDEPSKTLKAGDHGVPGGENTLRLEDGSVRYFSVRECARIQTFPDEWFFEGSWTETMRQLGNAVPTRLAEVVGRQLAEVITPVSSLAESLTRAMREAGKNR